MTTALPNIQVLVDWVNNPIGPNAIAGSNWTDISAYVSYTRGITISRGRQDNISVVQPARCTISLMNDDGRFTPDNTASPYFPGVILGRRIQVRVEDEAGTWHTRFDGMISEYDVIDTATGAGTTVNVICADVLAFLNRYPAYSCWTVEETSYQAKPALQYLMNEPAGSAGLRDSSGNNGPLLASATYAHPPYETIPQGSTNCYVASPTITYQGGMNPVEGAVNPLAPVITFATDPITSPVSSPLPSVKFGGTLTNNKVGNTNCTATPSSQFQGQLNSPLVIGPGKSYTLVGWLFPDGTILDNGFFQATVCALGLANPSTGSALNIEAKCTGGTIKYQASYYSNYLLGSPSGSTTGGPVNGIGGYQITTAAFMVAVVISGTTVNFYLGGNLQGSGQVLLTGTSSVTLPAGISFDLLSIGGPIGGGNGFFGNISLVTLYNSALTSTQLADLAQWGASGPEGMSTGTVFSRAAYAYTGLPAYWQGTVDPGLSVTDYVDITGAQPSTVVQNVQGVEKGLVFTDASGRINLHDRSRRMGATAPPAVTLPAGSYDPGLAPKVNDQYLVNSEALQNARGGSGVLAQNTDSISKYGVYANGSVQSPQQAPYTTFCKSVSVYQLVPVLPGQRPAPVYAPQNIADAASWDVNTLSHPLMKLAALTMNMLGNTTGQNEYVAPSTLYGIEINQSVKVGHNLAWWPTYPMNSELFIEGVNESYSLTESHIAFYTSPAFAARAWIPGSSDYGQLDVSARVGISDMHAVTGLALLYPPPPSYSATMNRGGGANGFIGAYDQAGISSNLQMMVRPPLAYLAQQTITQSANASTPTMVTWDTTFIDTVNGTNKSGEAGTTYTVQVPGWYEIFVTVQFETSPSGAMTCWIARNQGGSIQQIAPVTLRYWSGLPLGINTSALLWCEAGDAIGASFSSDVVVVLNTNNGGSTLSLRYRGAGSNRN